ncbi:hypothetical protein GCM10011529_00120 [Polymorphobacter glacialis]|uniref:Uncharacterized protein n=1 Tax=Sandarakinorhabdus glacialis TaxID=1614636 RepID=A0A917E3J5_9SPHN|nr:hypothetical protein [Polymorphobacter glacialis]GGD98092.1 hypothetical protein GCM10011529_00120 [Polymorphobacter glacialis]
MLTRGFDFRTRVRLALVSALIAYVVALVVIYVISNLRVSWRIEVADLRAAFGILLLIPAISLLNAAGEASPPPPPPLESAKGLVFSPLAFPFTSRPMASLHCWCSPRSVPTHGNWPSSSSA